MQKDPNASPIESMTLFIVINMTFVIVFLCCEGAQMVTEQVLFACKNLIRLEEFRIDL